MASNSITMQKYSNLIWNGISVINQLRAARILVLKLLTPREANHSEVNSSSIRNENVCGAIRTAGRRLRCSAVWPSQHRLEHNPNDSGNRLVQSQVWTGSVEWWRYSKLSHLRWHDCHAKPGPVGRRSVYSWWFRTWILQWHFDLAKTCPNGSGLHFRVCSLHLHRDRF